MRRSLTAAVLFVSLTGAAFAQDTQSFDRIERGRYLAVLGDCAGCHTAPGGAPFAGGLALQTPFGTLVAPNITPDPDTGIGNMTNDEFLAALHEGRGHNGKRLYPAMPYPAYTKMTDDDVLAMRAYFATVAPVNNRVVSNQLPFPLNIRLAMVFWNGLNFTPGRYQPNPQKSAAWNRGAYIVEGPAHCGTCHTPKTLLGGDKNSCGLDRSYASGLVCARYHQRSAQGHWWMVQGRPCPVPQDRHQQVDAGFRADGRSGVAFHIADDRRRYPGHRDLSEGQRRGRSRARSRSRSPPTTMRCARARRSTRTVVPRATRIQAKARSICFRDWPVARWCNRTIRPRWRGLFCMGRARFPRLARRRLPRCPLSIGGLATRRSRPF